MKRYLTPMALIALALTLNASSSKTAQGQEKKKVWIKVIDSVMVSEDLLDQAARDAVIADKCEQEIKATKKQAKTNLWRGRIEGAGLIAIFYAVKYWRK